jgi:hypothetical protein
MHMTSQQQEQTKQENQPSYQEKSASGQKSQGVQDKNRKPGEDVRSENKDKSAC